MGDLRADIKIQMSMWGHKYKQEFWINYWDDGDGNDARVKNWFNECYQKSMTKYYAQMDKLREKEREESEKAQYKRLKAKYEGTDLVSNNQDTNTDLSNPPSSERTKREDGGE